MTQGTTWQRVCVLCARAGRDKRLDSGHVCVDCAVGLQRSLNQILDLVGEAAEWVEPGVGSGSRAPGFESKPPVNVEAFDAQFGLTVAPHFERQAMPPTILETLESWARMIADLPENHDPHRNALNVAQATLTNVVTYLRRAMNSLIYDPNFPIEDFADELRDCVSAVYRWNQQRKTANIWRVNCPADVGEQTCGRELSVTGDDLNAHIRCRRCGSEWSVQWLMRVAATNAESHLWLDGDAICARLGVDRRTLARWVREGRTVKEHGMYDARPLFTTTAQYGA